MGWIVTVGCSESADARDLSGGWGKLEVNDACQKPYLSHGWLL